jgi:hypothetical protein
MSHDTCHTSHATLRTSHVTCLTSHFFCQGYNAVCTLNIKCSGDIGTNDVDSVVARWFSAMAETMIAAGIPRDKLFTHAGANWGTMPEDVEWNTAESAVIDQVLLLLLLLTIGMMVAVMITRKLGDGEDGHFAFENCDSAAAALRPLLRRLLTTAAGSAGLVVLRHSLGRESGCR